MRTGGNRLQVGISFHRLDTLGIKERHNKDVRSSAAENKNIGRREKDNQLLDDRQTEKGCVKELGYRYI